MGDFSDTKYDFTHYAGVIFPNSARAYFFGAVNPTYKDGDKVIVETVRGIELGEISIAPIEIAKFKQQLELKPILRKATDLDISTYENNLKDAVVALKICEEEVKACNLDMRLTSCEYVLDKTKVIFSYTADERVDFRELLKALASRLHTRIELRQIGSRDKAKSVGGIGICGQQLCCSSFLNEFDGISINRAKNQMLTINIPKLSGHCGKLMCCLRYEDDVYTEAKKKYPELGTTVYIDRKEYKITGINVISNTLKLENEEEIINLSLEDFKKQASYSQKKQENKNEEN